MTVTDHQGVELILLCGFLGSGKTSLVVDFLAQNDLNDTAVIINEAGEIGIDGVLVQEETTEVPFTLLSNGCVCCSLRSSLVYTVEQLLEAPRPSGSPPLRRIVLETSGVSKPSPILASLADPALVVRRLRVLVVSTFDAQVGELNTERFDEAVAQLSAAQRIVFTKLDCVDETLLPRRINYVSSINPLAQIVADTDRRILVEKAFQCYEMEQNQDEWQQQLTMRDLSTTPAHPRIHVLKGIATRALYWEDVAQWLDDLAGFCGDRLLRTKLLVHVSDCAEPILIQSVGTTYSMPRRLTKFLTEADVIVVMTMDLDAISIMNELADGIISLSNALMPTNAPQPLFNVVSH
jgi:G3E family GTPase